MKRMSVRRSAVHGKGVFALKRLPAGERLFEYRGLVTTWREATRYCARREDTGHTFLFGLSDGRVIDGGRGGNSARWLNHACMANCEAFEVRGRVYIRTTRTIRAGEELYIDYALEVPAGMYEASLADYPCRCASSRCRGTLLAAPA